MEAESAVSVAGLKRALECPICFQTPKAGPLYQCENGHILCSGCIEKVQECPQCRSKLPATKIRCLFAEQQLEWLPKKCKYSKNGCDFEQMPSRKQIVNDHETECPHRDVNCFIHHCSKNVSLTKILDHLKTAPHKVPPVEVMGAEETDKLNISHVVLQYNEPLYINGWMSWVATHFTLNSQKEFYLAFTRSPSGLLFIWVYIIGTPKEEEDFTYTVTVFDTNKANYRTGKANVISIDTPWKTICSLQSDNMAGLILSDSLIKKFGGSLGNANENIKLPYSVKIEPVKITVKIDPSKNKSVKNSSTKRKHAKD